MYKVGSTRDAVFGIQVYCNLSCVASFGSDDNNAIGTRRTVNSSWRRIFQYINLLNIIWIELVVAGSLHTVNDKQRTVTTVDRTGTTQQDIHILSHGTGSHHNIRTRNFTLKGLHYIACRSTLYVFLTYRHDRTTQIGFSLRTITSAHNHLLQQIRILLHHNVQRSSPFQVYHLFHISHIRYFNWILARGFQSELTVKIGNHSITCPFFYYGSPDYGLSLAVLYSSRNVLRNGIDTQENE